MTTECIILDMSKKPGRPKGQTLPVHTTIDVTSFQMMERLMDHYGLIQSQVLRMAIRDLYRKTFPGSSPPPALSSGETGDEDIVLSETDLDDEA